VPSYKSICFTLETDRSFSWLYAQIIIPLLRIHFYVTESGQYGYALKADPLKTYTHVFHLCSKRIFYYRKPVWAHIHKLAMEGFKKAQVFTPIPLVCSHHFGSSSCLFSTETNSIN